MKIVSKIGEEVVGEFVYVLSYTKNGYIIILGVGDFLVFANDNIELLNSQVESAALSGIEEFVFMFSEEQRKSFCNPKKLQNVLKEVGSD